MGDTQKESGWLRVISYVTDRPQALAIIFALALLGMFLGIVPSTLSMNQATIEKKIDTVLVNQEAQKLTTQTRYDGLQDQLRAQNDAEKDQTDKMIQIMRGMCLIIAKQSNDSAALSYCNP